MGIARRREVKTDKEQNLITGLIVSSRFCRDVLRLVNPSHYQTDLARIVTSWVKDYYNKFHEAPGATIQDIFAIEAGKLKDPAIAELVQGFLSNISQKYEQAGESFNDAYHIEQSISYLNERADIIMAERILAAHSSGKPQEAEKARAEHRQVRKKLSKWVNPFDPDYAETVFDAKFGEGAAEDKEDFLFKFPGVLGDFLGPFERGWLIAWMGPLKRGKTWWLWETALQLVRAGKNVIFITLEMDDRGVSSRGYKRLLAQTDAAGSFTYPVFDCARNQDGSCNRPQRSNRYPLLVSGKTKPVFDPNLAYRPCTACRGQSEYRSATWFEVTKRNRISKRGLRSAVEAFSFQYGSKLWLISYPKFSANTSDVLRDIDELEYNEGFTPHNAIIFLFTCLIQRI